MMSSPCSLFLPSIRGVPKNKRHTNQETRKMRRRINQTNLLRRLFLLHRLLLLFLLLLLLFLLFLLLLLLLLLLALNYPLHQFPFVWGGTERERERKRGRERESGAVENEMKGINYKSNEVGKVR